MHNIAGGTPAICKLKHKGNTDFPKPTPSSPSPMYPSISLFSPEATLPTEQPELFDVALRTANHKRLIPPNGTSGKAGERRSRKENAHEGFKEKTNCTYFKHCWVWCFIFFSACSRGTVTVLTSFDRSNETLLYHSITLTFN